MVGFWDKTTFELPRCWFRGLVHPTYISKVLVRWREQTVSKCGEAPSIHQVFKWVWTTETFNGAGFNIGQSMVRTAPPSRDLHRKVTETLNLATELALLGVFETGAGLDLICSGLGYWWVDYYNGIR